MQVQIVPGTSGLIIPGAPTYAFTAEEKAVAGLPGLKAYIDIDVLAANLAGVTRVGGYDVANADSGAAKVNSYAQMNNRPVANFPAALDQFWTSIGVFEESFTVLTAVRITNNSYILNSVEGLANNSYTLHAIDNTTTRFNIARPAGTGVGVIAYERQVPLNTPTVVGMSFDKGTLTGAAIVGDAERVISGQSVVQAISVTDPRQDRLAVGRYGASGITGHVGNVMIFDRGLHLAANRSALLEAISILKTAYGIA